MSKIVARYYDGKNSEPHDVRLCLYRDGEIRILGLNQDCTFPLATLDIAPLGPRSPDRVAKSTHIFLS